MAKLLFEALALSMGTSSAIPGGRPFEVEKRANCKAGPGQDGGGRMCWFAPEEVGAALDLAAPVFWSPTSLVTLVYICPVALSVFLAFLSLG